MKHGLFRGRERSYWGSGLCQALGFTHFVLFNPYNSPANERDHPHLTEEDTEAQPESYTSRRGSHVYKLGLFDARPSEGQQRPLQEFLRLHRAHVGKVGGGAQRQSLALPDSVRVNRALRI